MYDDIYVLLKKNQSLYYYYIKKIACSKLNIDIIIKLMKFQLKRFW